MIVYLNPRIRSRIRGEIPEPRRDPQEESPRGITDKQRAEEIDDLLGEYEADADIRCFLREKNARVIVLQTVQPIKLLGFGKYGATHLAITGTGLEAYFLDNPRTQYRSISPDETYPYVRELILVQSSKLDASDVKKSIEEQLVNLIRR